MSKTFFSTLFSSAFICFCPWSSIVFLYFSEAFPQEENVNLACLFTLLWSEGSMSWHVRNSYLSILHDDNAYVFAASMLISYCTFSSLILSSIVMIIFYILSKRFFLKREGLSDARVASIIKKEYGFAVHFLYKFIKSLKLISDEWLNAICWK